MFSYTSSITPLANLSSSIHHLPSPIFSGFDASNVFLNNQLHDLFTTNPGIAESLTNMALSDNITMTDSKYYGHSNLITNKKPQPLKKDRHSKICTAQGLRDRRVRLSIGIAREFFDLQDMLGFDKASKTLEWLLSKSRKAIKELAENRNEGKRLFSISHGVAIPDSKSLGDKKEMEKHNEEAFQVHLAKESRGKARARQRTREKIQGAKKGLNTRSQTSLNQFNSSNDQFPCNIQFKEPPSSPALANHAHVSEESFMLKRKWNPSSILTHQQNFGIVSNDISGNSNYISDLPQNWDTDGAIPITNMNMLTTGLQSCGKPWETPTTINVNTDRCIMSIIDILSRHSVDG